MKIFTKEAWADVAIFLPHYITGAFFITVAILAANLLSSVIIGNVPALAGLDQANNRPHQERNHNADLSGLKAPSSYKIGVPYAKGISDVRKPLVVEVYADWCPFCKRITPDFHKVSKKIRNVNFSAVNGDKPENRYIMKKYNINKFPTFLVIDTTDGSFEEITLSNDTFNAKGLTMEINKAVEKIKK